MHKALLGYLPANLVPAVVSVASIGLYTRLLEPAELGRFTLVFGIVMAAQTTLFYAPALAMTRFHAAASRPAGGAAACAAGAASLRASLYGIVAVQGLGVAAIAAWVAMMAGGGWELGLGTALLLLRAVVAMNQSVNRASCRTLRYTIVECLHAAAGLGFGVLLLGCGVPGCRAVLAGLAVAAALCVAMDCRIGWSAFRAGFGQAALGADFGQAALRAGSESSSDDTGWTRRVLAFGWPLALAYGVTCCLQYADRLLVGTLAGPAALGIYGTAFSLADRPVTLICVSVTSGTFPLAVEAYVKRGAQAGRVQAGRNGAVLIALAVPAAVGLAFAAPAIGAVLVGPRYSAGVAALLPVLAATALMRGVCTHFIDHAFHLSGRSRAMLAVYAPSAVAAVALSACLIPRYGPAGAAWAALSCQTGAALTGWAAASRVLPLWLPPVQIARTALCTMVLAAILFAASGLPADAAGLGLRVAIGAAGYGAAQLLTGYRLPGRGMVLPAPSDGRVQ